MGVKTLYEYFYKLAYGDKGTDKATLVNDCLDVADAEIKANKDAKHSQNTDTHLGTVDANINMNTHKLTSLAVPSANGDSVRATTKITEVNLESAIDHKDLTDDPHLVTKAQVGLSNVVNLKVKLDATAAPGVSNDNTEGYAVGSRWVDVTADKAYVCLDASTGAAVWTEVTGAGLANIVEDTTPQLGGNLDANDHAILENVTTISSAHTMTVAEAGTVLVSCAATPYTITLPTAVGNTGLTYHFIKTDANYFLITLDGGGAETFNYENSTGTPNLTYLRLNTYCAEVTIVSDGTDWQVINEAMGQVPSCQVRPSESVTNIKASQNNIIPLLTEIYDIGSNWDNSTWISGTADGDVADHLQDDTNSQFTSAMEGYRVKNTSDTTYAWVINFNDAGDLTLSADIFVDGDEAYEIKKSEFVAPVAGQYYLSGLIRFSAFDPLDEDAYLIIQVNGATQLTYGKEINMTNPSFFVSMTYFLSIGDVVTFVVYHTGAETVDMHHTAGNTQCGVRLISKD